MTTTLANLPKVKLKKNAKRVGRGIGSGKGGHTSSRGSKGQKSRGGTKFSPQFEGGQLPIGKRLPQMGGFRNPSRKFYKVFNVSFFEKFTEENITPKFLEENGLVKLSKFDGVKILGDGKLARKINFKGFSYSASAKAQIVALGGTAE